MSTAEQLFNQLCDAATFQGVQDTFRDLCNELGLQGTHYGALYPALKEKLTAWKCQDLWKLLDKRASLLEYDERNACAGKRVCIIGAGPIGLRTAVEAALLGANVDVLEKRATFSRNNVLHLWPFIITDLRNLGAKRFYPKFCAGAIDHISIRILQCMLLKVCLLLGVKVFDGVKFCQLLEPSGDKGWMIDTSPSCDASQHQYDIIVGADGKKYSLPGFKTKEFRAKLAIAITVNFVNHNTTSEASVEEISGVSYIYNQRFFDDLKKKHGIDLENIVYYKDETHYFVMTAKKHSLLKKGVLRQDKTDPSELLSPANIDRSALMTYSKEAAHYSTKGQLCVEEFVINDKGFEDVALFDFTSLFAAENAARIVERRGKRLLMCLVGDSLLEPFWPTGSGCARGFLGAFDTAWMMKGFAADEDPIKLLEEREAIHLLLPQTTSEKLHKNYAAFTINPSTRYPNLSGLVPLGEVASLYDTGTGPILNVQRTHVLPSKAEKRRPAVLVEATNRKRSKDDMAIQDKPELISDSQDVLKKPRVVDALTDNIKSAHAAHPITKTHSPKSKPKLKSTKSEGRFFIRPALKPKPTITFTNDSRAHKITHKKSSDKVPLPKDNSVTLLAHTKVTDENSSHVKKGMKHKEKPVVSANKPTIPSNSHTTSTGEPSVSSNTPNYSRDRSPPRQDVNVLEMKATFEKRDLDAKSRSTHQHVSRRQTVGSIERSAARVPKSASFSDLKDKASSEAFHSSKSHPTKHRHFSAGRVHAEEQNEISSTSVKDYKQPEVAKQPASHEKSSFMKWLTEPHKQVVAMVASLARSSSYSPKDQTDYGNAGKESYTVLPNETSTSVIQNSTPTHAEEITLTKSDKAVAPANHDSMHKVTSKNGTSDTPVEPKESPPIESQNKTSDVPEGTLVVNDSLSDTSRVQPLIKKLEPSMGDSSDDDAVRRKASAQLDHHRIRRDSLTVIPDVETASTVKVVEPLWLAKVRASLSKCLERLRRGYDIIVAKTALEILFTITSNVERYPDNDNYRRVRVASEHFSSKVWDYPCCQDFLTRAGWVEIDDLIVVPLGHQLTTSLEVVQKHLDIVNNMIWSMQIDLPEPVRPTVMERLQRQHKAKLNRRESYTTRVVNMATETVAQAAYHQKQQRSLRSKRSPSRSDSEREDSISPEPLPEIDEDRAEELTTMKATRTARRVWIKRLAQNTFSKPEQQWRPKLEAELYDMEQNKPRESDDDNNPAASYESPQQTSDPLKAQGTVYLRRHTVSSSSMMITRTSSSGSSSMSPPPSDVTPFNSQSDVNSDEVFSDDVTSDHGNKVVPTSNKHVTKGEELQAESQQPCKEEDDVSECTSVVGRITTLQENGSCAGITSRHSNHEHKEDDIPKEHQVQEDTVNNSFSEQTSQLTGPDEKGKECDVVVKEEQDSSSISNHSIAQNRRQEEMMVLEAGSKAAEVAKSVFGK